MFDLKSRHPQQNLNTRTEVHYIAQKKEYLSSDNLIIVMEKSKVLPEDNVKKNKSDSGD